MIHTYKDLVVWQRAVELSVGIYQLTSQFPKEEVYGLTSQIRRASISIASNVAEGRFRGTRKDFAQFLRIAYGSGAELETQLVIAKQLPFGLKLNFEQVEQKLDEVMRMLNAMIRKINPNPTN